MVEQKGRAEPRRQRKRPSQDLCVPVGIEKLLFLAAQDPGVKDRLLADRARTVGELGVELRPLETAVLASVSDAALESMISAVVPENPLRRKFMRLVAAAAGSLAAGTVVTSCNLKGGDDGILIDASVDADADSDTDADTDTDSDTVTDGDTDTEGPWANVIDVTATGNAGAYTIAATIHSSDVDCSQYCDWWEILSLDEKLIYRRILLHSHTEGNGQGNPFTRDGGPVPIAGDQEVVVRAHMAPGGYIGMAMRGTVAGGFADAPEIGPQFAADVESLDPQPEECLF